MMFLKNKKGFINNTNGNYLKRERLKKLLICCHAIDRQEGYGKCSLMK